jgi:hypothetical protein
LKVYENIGVQVPAGSQLKPLKFVLKAFLFLRGLPRGLHFKSGLFFMHKKRINKTAIL